MPRIGGCRWSSSWSATRSTIDGCSRPGASSSLASYAPDEAVSLIRAQNATLALLPSIWPETWCFGLGEAWRAGLRVAAFDIGAQAERIRRTGRGFLLPLGLPAHAINNALIAASGLSRQ